MFTEITSLYGCHRDEQGKARANELCSAAYKAAHTIKANTGSLITEKLLSHSTQTRQQGLTIANHTSEATEHLNL